MSRFDPNLAKSPEQWCASALRDNLSDRSGHLIVAGIVGGGFLASATTPLLGGILAAYCFVKGMQQAIAADKNKKLIKHVGCIAHVLNRSDFRSYRNQAGDEKVLAELQYAESEGMSLSAEAWEFMDELSAKLPAAASSSQDVTAERQSPSTQTAVIDYYDPTAVNQIDIVSEMSDRVNNTVIIGIPGSGKGMLVANAIREIKRKHPNIKIFVIDPKADPKEAGYFTDCDVVKPFACMDAKPSTVAAWAESSFEDYAKYAQQNNQTLLIVDEGTMLGNKLSQAKSTLLVDKLTAYTSGGDSVGRNVWIVMQSPYVTGASLNLSTTSQMTSIVIAFSENIGAIAQWKSAKIFKQLSLDEIAALIEASPKGRAIYYGKTGRWYMMPELTNYSAYDRDSRKYLPGSESENVTIDSPQGDSSSDINSSTEPQETQISERAQAVLDYFNAAKNKEPKTLRDLKKSAKLSNYSDIVLTVTLTELVSIEKIIFNGEDQWSKVDW
ncbi:MAG: ATP-binding protein [Nostocaceae cyanobacterium]|nr:ATP-binding protein [Nostocaceae cyanobacterium]